MAGGECGDCEHHTFRRIVPVHSGDVRQSFNYGADMVPGAWKDGDEAKGYTIAKALMEGTYGK